MCHFAFISLSTNLILYFLLCKKKRKINKEDRKKERKFESWISKTLCPASENSFWIFKLLLYMLTYFLFSILNYKEKIPPCIPVEIIKTISCNSKCFPSLQVFLIWNGFWLEMRPKSNFKSKPWKSIFAADTSLTVTPQNSFLFFPCVRCHFKEIMLITARLQGAVGSKKQLYERW